jgi:hypothetical protein
MSVPTLPTPTKKDQIEEIIKCGKDPVYFMKKYCKIQHPERGLLPFATYSFQDDCVKEFVNHRLNIILKSRQLGLSTLCAAYATWLAIFYKDKNVLIIATKLPTAMNMIKKCKVVLDNLPKWLLMPKYEPTKQSISFNNGSQIVAIPTSEDAGRSEALSLLIVDEAAIIRDFEEIWTGLKPTISTGGSCIVLSTPKGVGGQYYRLWTEAEAGLNGFNPIRLHWTVHPEHDEEWFKKESRGMGKRQIAQEFMCDFIASGDTFLQPDELDYLRGLIMAPNSKEGQAGNVWVWSPPIAGHQYIIGADVSRGDAHDFSAFHVVDRDDGEVCAEYMGKVPPEVLAEQLNEWGKRYNTALIIPENNTFGYFVCTHLRDKFNYKRLYYHNHTGDPFNYIPNDPKSELPGFPNTNQKIRTQVLAHLEELIRNKQLKPYSRRLFDQMQSFIWDNNKPKASKDSYDDLIMSLAFAAWLIEGSATYTAQAKAMAYAMLAATCVDRKDINKMPGNINEAQPLVNPNISGINANSVMRPRNPKELIRSPYARFVSDFDWLRK